MKTAFYIMKFWQTGNVGAHNVCKVNDQPVSGFDNPEDAEYFIIDKVNSRSIEYITYDLTVMKIFKQS